MIKPGSVFSPPQTPAARCLHLVRLNPIITRSELVEATGLSQPTITRATAALLEAGLVQERTDLTRTRGRGRPTVPLEVADNKWILAGIAIGTSRTHIALFDTMGRTLREDDISTPVARLSESDFIEHIMAGVNRLTTGISRTLVSVGVTTSGNVDEDGLVWAANLGWEGVDIAARLRYQFNVPVVVSSAIPAILGSETQSADLNQTGKVLVLFADDSTGAALSTEAGVTQLVPLPRISSELLNLHDSASEDNVATQAVLDALAAREISASTLAEAATIAEDNETARGILDERAHLLASIAADLVTEHNPVTVVLAGSAFIDDPHAAKLFASSLRQHNTDAQLRLIPTHREIVRAIARAVALDPLLRVPLSLQPSTASVRS
ncbi:ROK family transcriptional regulator [Corynebacterium ammoniagenes]|uniref:Transcriptional regulator n=1 Tax=Corynebacterium ammoniagenes TaxID=1697 RepID=A0AAV5GDK6_CORAM|nr:ROK family transcriptional regulator [Corynebacterium ammoniagenes]APT81555.1 Crp/Fnr family transcriptional regulator [Corynebacterium ammoniagenes DSM 20306]AQS72682.1 Crp/Fnr family transcriptional regulator [Corynebacterium ammoniagenes]NMF32458.1 ROK family transcriptional regulator [Corynebacterium ammoniagenes]GJN43666.1 transcriptional regulator [Corynebacterium ammoniagenes]